MVEPGFIVDGDAAMVAAMAASGVDETVMLLLVRDVEVAVNPVFGSIADALPVKLTVPMLLAE